MAERLPGAPVMVDGAPVGRVLAAGRDRGGTVFATLFATVVAASRTYAGAGAGAMTVRHCGADLPARPIPAV